jgi:ribosomal protein S18 acetylase RimI-like enzyme/2-polyprenyl-3-methyl-5-hydroxy-6-metoxy-1,4-benzoquinol methylase
MPETKARSLGVDAASERQFVEGLVPGYITSDTSSQTRLMRELLIRTFKPYVRRGRALELGSEIGFMSERIARLVDHLDIVDGSEAFLKQVEQRHIPNATCHHCLFEEFRPAAAYDCVFASHILEHLIDVRAVLRMIASALKPDGCLFVAVPNARALSRQLARHMGLIDSLYSLTPNDLKGGHRRVYDQVLLTRELEAAGFEIVAKGGILFKPFADFQMDKLIDIGLLGPEQCEGLHKLGHEYPDMCADIYAVARIRPRPTVRYTLKTASEQEICSHLKESDSNFSPPLSTRVRIDDYSRKIFENAVTFEARAGDALIGLVAAYFNDLKSHEGFVTVVSVVKGHTGQGIATELMTQSIAYAKQHGFKTIRLEVQKDNCPAIRLYQKFGFEHAGKRGDYATMELETGL